VGYSFDPGPNEYPTDHGSGCNAVATEARGTPAWVEKPGRPGREFGRQARRGAPPANLAIGRPRVLNGGAMTNAPTILVVEDEEDAVLLLESAFRRAQFSNPVHRVSHGALAIEYLTQAVSAKNRPVPLPAFVLLDLKLPLVSGIEVLKWIRAHPLLHSLIVIIFTSSSEPRDIADAYRAGANSYLVKPTNLSALTELASGLRSYWMRLNVPPNEPEMK
jgi:CheY-like chemotaxis protein